MEIAVWTVNGVPSRLVWEGRRYRVNDTPTRLTAAEIVTYIWHPAITHPLPSWAGWRFQAVSDQGQALVFDVREVDGQTWQLVRAWDYDAEVAGVAPQPPTTASAGTKQLGQFGSPMLAMKSISET